MEFRSQRKLRHRKLKGRKFTFCDFTAFFAGDVLLWSAYHYSIFVLFSSFLSTPFHFNNTKLITIIPILENEKSPHVIKIT